MIWEESLLLFILPYHALAQQNCSGPISRVEAPFLASLFAYSLPSILTLLACPEIWFLQTASYCRRFNLVKVLSFVSPIEVECITYFYGINLRLQHTHEFHRVSFLYPRNSQTTLDISSRHFQKYLREVLSPQLDLENS